MPELKSRRFYLCQIIISSIVLVISTSIVDANPNDAFIGLVFGFFLNLVADCFLLVGLWKFFRYKKLLKEQKKIGEDLPKKGS